MTVQIDIVERLRFDAVRCEAQFSKGVAGNIEEAAAEIERLRALLIQIREVCDDNADAACNQAMALTFVRSVAASADKQNVIGEVKR